MIKKLRTKFIAAAMSALLIVLTAIVGAVNVVNYCNIVDDADATLTLLKKNEGKFPVQKGKKDGYAMPHGKSGKTRVMSPELPYESRFFSVIVDSSNAVISSDTENIAAVDENDAVQMARNVIEKNRESGFEGNYRYIVGNRNDKTQVIFLDCTGDLSTFRTFLFTSCGISAAGLAAVFVLMLLFSNHIIKPVSESYEKQKRFITDAGHEIKTPITIIDADAEVLEADIQDNEWLMDIRKQTKRLAALTNDLIYLSRMDEEQQKIQTIDFPMSDVVSETAQSFQALAATQHKAVVTDIEQMITVNGDENSLRKLVSILLDNALKYASDNGTISVTLKKTGKTVNLTVSNPADNISKGNLNYLFDRFYRADKSRNSEKAGYGLGLSIAKAVVTAHKGKLNAYSPDGASVVINVQLPEKNSTK